MLGGFEVVSGGFGVVSGFGDDMIISGCCLIVLVS